MAGTASKQFGEKVFMCYTPVWILIVAYIVLTKSYEWFTPQDFVSVGLTVSLPFFVVPFLFASNEEAALPILERFAVKANVYVLILGYLGNHFYTHYFYNVLGVSYTGPLGPSAGPEINKVPVSMFLMTHAYFMSYHIFVTPVLRKVKGAVAPGYQFVSIIGAAVLLAVATAIMETWTISSFPYYTYPDFFQMITIGSAFYATFFIVTFPMFFRLDEDPDSPWTMLDVIRDALAAMMLVLLCADIWRLAFGMVNDSPVVVPYG